MKGLRVRVEREAGVGDKDGDGQRACRGLVRGDTLYSKCKTRLRTSVGGVAYHLRDYHQD